jgi:transposase
MTLTPKVQQRVMVMMALERGQLLMAEAAQLLGRCVRQVRRLRSGYRVRGPAALVHGNQGRPSPRRTDEATRGRLVTLAQQTYPGVNHQHLTELVAEREGLRLSRPTVHRILHEAGIRSPRRRRERMPQPGMLILLDGSTHPWLETRGPWLTLLAAMDDATGAVLAAEFRDHEDAQGYLHLLHTLTHRHGVPLAVYTDRHGIFHREPRTPLSLQEQLQGAPAPTQVGRVLRDLGIRWIPASSPQGKGRIERLFGTFQDRLLAELRLARIRHREGANAFLVRFLRRYNARFTHLPTDATPAYRPWPPTLNPDTVFCFKYLRTVANDNTVTLGPHRLQILPGPNGRSYARAQVEVHHRLDGSFAIAHHGRLLPVAPLHSAASLAPLRAQHLPRPGSERLTGHTNTSKTRFASPRRDRDIPRKISASSPQRQPVPRKPSPDHPWNRYARENKRRKELRQAGVTFSLNP